MKSGNDWNGIQLIGKKYIHQPTRNPILPSNNPRFGKMIHQPVYLLDGIGLCFHGSTGNLAKMLEFTEVTGVLTMKNSQEGFNMIQPIRDLGLGIGDAYWLNGRFSRGT